MENGLYSMMASYVNMSANHVLDTGKFIARNAIKTGLLTLTGLLLADCSVPKPSKTHRQRRFEECNKKIYNHHDSDCHRRAVQNTGSLTFIELKIGEMPIYATFPEVYARREDV